MPAHARKKIRLNETAFACRQDPAQALQVDEQENVVRGVKFLGFVSENGRRYLPEAVRKKLSAYEGIKVNIDHPENAHATGSSSRRFSDRFGRLVNVRLEPAGGYCDLAFNPEHREAKAFVWWAKNDPGAIGLSHNATGSGEEDDNGTFVVDEIHEVYSVDLVADPATTKGLFESKQPMPKPTFKQLFEATKSSLKPELLKLLQEMGDTYADMGASGTDGVDGSGTSNDDVVDGTDGDGDHKKDLLAAISKLLEKDDADSQDAIRKIMAILMPKKKVEEDDLENEADDEGGQDGMHGAQDEGDGAAKKEGKQAKKGSLAETVNTLKAKLDAYETRDARTAKLKQAKQLCKAARLPEHAITKEFIGTLVACKDEKRMQRLIDDRRKILSTKPVPRKPKSAGPDGSDSITFDQFAEALQESMAGD